MHIRHAVSVAASSISILLFVSAFIKLPTDGNISDVDFRVDASTGEGRKHRKGRATTGSNFGIGSCKTLLPPEYWEPLLRLRAESAGGQCKPATPTQEECNLIASLGYGRTPEIVCAKGHTKSKKKRYGNAKCFGEGKVRIESEPRLEVCPASSPTTCWQRLAISELLRDKARCSLAFLSSTIMTGDDYEVSSSQFFAEDAPKMLSEYILRSETVTPCSNHIGLVLSCEADQYLQNESLSIIRLIVVDRISEKSMFYPNFNIHLIVIDSLPRLAFYAKYPKSVDVLRTLQERGISLSDFALYQSLTNETLEERLPDLIRWWKHDVDGDLASENTIPPGDLLPHRCQSGTEGYRTWKEVGNCSSSNRQFSRRLSLTEQLRAQLHMNGFLCAALNRLDDMGFLGHSPQQAKDLRLQSLLTSLQMEYSQYILSTKKQLIALNVIDGHYEPVSQGITASADELLSRHLSSSFSQNRQTATINIIFSIRSRDSYVDSETVLTDMSNPIFFALLSPLAKRKLPSGSAGFLKMNTDRIVILPDIGKTISWLVSYAFSVNLYRRDDTFNSGSGLPLFTAEVSQMRSCSNLGLKFPTLCICEDQWVSADNDTVQVAKAHFAISSMNEIVLRETQAIRHSFSHSPFGDCLKLYGVGFHSVFIRRLPNHLVTRMVVMVTQKDLPKYKTVIEYLVAIAVYRSQNVSAAGERFSFNGYSKLTDFPEEMNCELTLHESDLCHCISTHRTFTYTPADIMHQMSVSHFGLKPLLIPVHQMCLVLSVLDFGETISYSIANVCNDRSYDIKLVLYAKHVVLSSENLTVFQKVPALREQRLVTLMKSSYYRPMTAVGHQISYTVSFT